MAQFGIKTKNDLFDFDINPPVFLSYPIMDLKTKVEHLYGSLGKGQRTVYKAKLLQAIKGITDVAIKPF